MLINVKMPTVVGILTSISMINTSPESFESKNFFCNCFISETTSYNIYKHNTFYNTQVHVYVSHTTKYESLGVTLSIKT